MSFEWFQWSSFFYSCSSLLLSVCAFVSVLIIFWSDPWDDQPTDFSFPLAIPLLLALQLPTLRSLFVALTLFPSDFLTCMCTQSLPLSLYHSCEPYRCPNFSLSSQTYLDFSLNSSFSLNLSLSLPLSADHSISFTLSRCTLFGLHLTLSLFICPNLTFSL